MELDHFRILLLSYLIIIMLAAEYAYKRSKSESQKTITTANFLFVIRLNNSIRPIIENM